MSVKAILVLCAQVLLLESAFGQCTSRAAVADTAFAGPIGLAAPGLMSPALASPFNLGAPCGLAASSLASPFGLAGPGLAASGFAGSGWPYNGIYGNAIEFSPTSGGALPVTSASSIAPVGISVASDNVYEGILSVAGELPFVGTVGTEGVVPSAGAGAVNHACGNGINAMVSEATAFAPAAAALAYPNAGLAAGLSPAALATPGLGCRANMGYLI